MFITFEGIEGSGKSTQIGLLEEWLQERGRTVLRTLEPGGSRLGKDLRGILLDVANTDLSSEAELFLYLADRAQHVRQVVRPALEAGQVVLCDRYADSTVAYQGYGRGLDPKLLHQFNDVAVAGLWPDRTYLLDLPPEVGLRRAFARNEEQRKTASEGRFEAESLSFHHRVREGYLTLAALHKQRYVLLDATRSVHEIFEVIGKDFSSV
jgi:dTMP kinase